MPKVKPGISIVMPYQWSMEMFEESMIRLKKDRSDSIARQNEQPTHYSFAPIEDHSSLVSSYNAAIDKLLKSCIHPQPFDPSILDYACILSSKERRALSSKIQSSCNLTSLVLSLFLNDQTDHLIPLLRRSSLPP